MDFLDKYNEWLNFVDDEGLLEDLKYIAGDEAEIKRRFASDLGFGTAGIRAVMGAGPGRVNIYTIRRAASGLAEYLKKSEGSKKVAIAYDSRINSDKFARLAAAALAEKSVEAYIFEELAPTPLLSFAVRELGCDAGIMITASHNTYEYNGFKCYCRHGYQMTEDEASLVTSEIEKLKLLTTPKGTFDEFLERGLVKYVDKGVYDKYYDCLLKNSIFPAGVKASDLKVLYTPLNGAGCYHVPQILKRLGIANLSVVESQSRPDGYFPTCPEPNPESRDAYYEAFKEAKKSKPDIILATDPDCDRLGVAVRSEDEYKLLSGNEIGILLLNYILTNIVKLEKLPKNPVIIKSFVTSPMASTIAMSYGCETKTVPIGFKYIGEYITELESKDESERFVFGFEESNGYIAGTYAREKDAVLASMLVCEMASQYALDGISILEVLSALYKKYGTFFDEIQNITVEDMRQVSEFMDELRDNPPRDISGIPVSSITDHKKMERLDVNSGELTETGLPKSNAIVFDLCSVARITVRPSGTEPKMKIYYSTYGQTWEEAEAIADGIKDKVNLKLTEHGLV